MSPALPRIGITCEVYLPSRGPRAYHLICDHRYAGAVREAGGQPLLLPIVTGPRDVGRSLDLVDGLVIVGGEDVDPRLYGERRREGTGRTLPARLEFEGQLYRQARKRDVPVLGVCYGMQLINVLHGGTLFQDIARDAGSLQDHRDRERPLHAVRVEPGSRLRSILGADRVRVHCEHHQAVRRLGRGFHAVAHAADGIVEAIEGDDERVLAVQWHPERTPGSSAARRLFRHLVRLARG